MPPNRSGALAQFVDRRFGRPTRPRYNPRDTSVGATTAALVAANNPNRVQLVIVNRGTSRIFVHTERTVSSTIGIPVEPDAVMIKTPEEDGEEVGYDHFALAATGTQTVFVVETLAE